VVKLITSRQELGLNKHRGVHLHYSLHVKNEDATLLLLR
jgi:hypothetical protein